MHRHSTIIIGFWLLLSAGSVFFIVTQLTIVSDISAFLPSAKSNQQQLLLRQLTQGSAARLLLLSIDGDDENRLSDVNRQFAKSIRALDFIARVENGEAQQLDASQY